MKQDFSAYDPSLITGLFGGSFDPIHNGHIRLAGQLLDCGVVDHIIFMPAYKAPHKASVNNASPQDRLRMIELALGEDPRMSVSNFEIDRGGISYTLDTLRVFAEHFGDNLRMIIGMDSLQDLHKWYKSDELVEICPFITYCRPGYPTPDLDMLNAQFGKKQARQLIDGIVEAQTYDISSTDVRKQIKHENFTESLIPEAVWTYIIDNGLYQ